MNKVLLLVLDDDDQNVNGDALSFYIPSEAISINDGVPENDYLILVEGSKFSDAMSSSIAKSILALLNAGKWLLIIPPFSIGSHDFSLGKERIQFRVYETERSKSIYCDFEEEQISEPFTIYSDLAIDFKKGRCICQNKFGDCVLSRSTLKLPGQFIICSAEVGRLSPLTSPKSVREFFLPHPVEKSEVHRLCYVSFCRCVILSKKDYRRLEVDILVLFKRVYQNLVPAKMGKKPQFYLGVVYAYKFFPLRCDESPAYLDAQIASHRDVLKVRIF